jgi:PAS domain S-box-containing protein
MKSEELLFESERRYRTLSELTIEGILIHEGGVIVDCNLSFARLFGYQREELIGNDYVRLLLSPEDHQKVRDLINKGITGIFEFTGIKKDKTTVQLEIEAKIITQNKKALRVVAFRDITFRKKAIEEIRLSDEKLAKITQSAHDAIILMDEKGNISFWNQAAQDLFGYGQEEVVGKNLHNLLAPARYLPLHQAAFSKFLQTGEGAAVGKTLELEAIKKGGEIIAVELSLSSIMIKGKWNAVGILRDISERKRYEAEILAAKQLAEEMNRLKTNFLATISHELRTPLNGMLGFAELLMDSLENEDYRQMVEIIRRSSLRLLNTFNLIIDLSVIEANELKIKKKEENLAELIHRISETYLSAAEEKNLYLEFDNHAPNPIYDTDPEVLSQIIINLLDNALKYTQEGGVTITLKRSELNGYSGFTIAVADTGIGISPQKISHIYDAFRQASEGYNRAYEGMGLGLHIAKRYVDELGGSIGVESEPDKGSCFTIFLPISTEPLKNEKDTIAPDQTTIEDKVEKPSMLKVLYVEDDPDHREFVSFFLKKDYEIHLAEDGPTGIEMAANTHFDIILMDINLGRQMNGLEAVKEIRKIPGYENTPIAAVTANAMVTQQAEYLSGGCSHYLSKPFTKKLLLDFLGKMVG